MPGADVVLAVVVSILGTVTLLGLLVGGYFVLRDTMRQEGRWGINWKAPACRACGASPPVVRVPKSLREMLWGGWTCPGCGREVDKWGREVPPEDRLTSA